MALGLEPAFSVDSGLAARPGGRDGLTVVVVLDVTAGEHTFDVGASAVGLGDEVAVGLAIDPSLRSKSLAAQLCDSGVLQGRLRVPGTVGDISVTADLRAARTVVAVECPVPLDKGGKGRIGWLVRQLRDAPNTITVEAFTRNSPAAEISPPSTTRSMTSGLRGRPNSVIGPPR